jgi:phenylalanyl-tRNA synthetase alpha chain
MGPVCGLTFYVMVDFTDIGEAFGEAKLELGMASSRADLERVKAKFLGANGVFRSLVRDLSTLPKDQKPLVGQEINLRKDEVERLLEERLYAIRANELAASLGKPIDPTLSKAFCDEILCHPLTKIGNRIGEIFVKLGFTIIEGTEIETEWFCFDALNTQLGHPSRDERDTFYFSEDTAVGNVSKHADERYLLRTQTSTTQIRTMLKYNPPIRMLSPGTVFRKDAIDATHSPNFHQCEGLVVEDGTSVCDLKATLDFFFTELIGEECEVRMRPSYFPFVSPGFEVDFRSKNLGKLSNKWVEVCGCGMVAPSVFRNC